LYSFSNKRDRTQLAVGVSKPYTYILGEEKTILFQDNFIHNSIKDAFL